MCNEEPLNDQRSDIYTGESDDCSKQREVIEEKTDGTCTTIYLDQGTDATIWRRICV